MKYAEVEGKYVEWANILKAIAHPIRLFIIDLLAEGEKNVSEIDEKLHIDISTVSRHLSTLKKAGIIQDKKRGNQVYYSLKIPCVMNFFSCAQQVLKDQIEKKLEILEK